MTMVVSSLLLCSWFVSRKFKSHHWVISKLLRDLEKLFAYSSRSLFENVRSTPLYEVLLDGINACLNTLLKTPNEPVIAKKLTATMRVQLDNYANDNKSIFVLPNCLCWLQKVCSKRCFYHFFCGPHRQWYWCIFWVVEHEVAWRGFPKHSWWSCIVHGFGQYFHQPTYDEGGAKPQSIYRTISS